jgi:hypothetical protein
LLPQKVEESEDDEEADIPRPILVKAEKLSIEAEKPEEEEAELPAKRTTRTKSKETEPVKIKVSKSDLEARKARTSPARSEKSVYEDAITEENAQPKVVVQKMTITEMATATPTPKADDTFVQQPGSANATYNVNQEAGTPGQSNATFQVSPVAMDGTFVLDKNSSDDRTGAAAKKTPDNYNESLMTEDNSQGEDSESECLAKLKTVKPAVGPKSTKAKKNELFK